MVGSVSRREWGSGEGTVGHLLTVSRLRPLSLLEVIEPHGEQLFPRQTGLGQLFAWDMVGRGKVILCEEAGRIEGTRFGRGHKVTAARQGVGLVLATHVNEELACQGGPVGQIHGATRLAVPGEALVDGIVRHVCGASGEGPEREGAWRGTGTGTCTRLLVVKRTQDWLDPGL